MILILFNIYKKSGRTTMNVIKKQSLVDQIYDQIRNDIISLVYPFGDKLVASELQEKYQVSSTPVREALNRLQQEGLVEYENNIGARIISIEPKDVWEIQELAITLHKAAIKLAMRKSDHSLIADELREHLNDYKRARTPKERTKSVHLFIGVFYKYCLNHRLDMNMGIIKGQQLILRNIYNCSAPDIPACVSYYEKMIEETLKGNTEEVIRLLQEDSDSAIPVILKAVEEKSYMKV
jgi:DNA-binding GntR family transcriptional regulator